MLTDSKGEKKYVGRVKRDLERHFPVILKILKQLHIVKHMPLETRKLLGLHAKAGQLVSKLIF